MDWIITNWTNVAELIAAVVGVASIIIRIFPVLDKNHWFLPFIKFVGKYIALNKTVEDKDRPK